MPAIAKSMPLVAALEVLRDVRSERAVVTSMGSAREWPRIAQHPLDFHYIPSTMGGAIPFALGLALARPDREFVVLSGDGSLLMNLGSLVTVTASGATNLSVVLLNNSVYEVTGGQATAAGAAFAARKHVDYCGLAENSGIPTARSFDDLDRWQQEAATALEQPGPRFIELIVAPVDRGFRLESPGPIVERLAAFRAAMA